MTCRIRETTVLLLVSLSIIPSFALLGWNADSFSSSSTDICPCDPRLHARLSFSTLSLDAAPHRGLLGGVGDVELENVAFYADTIDMSRNGLAWLSEPGLM
jgi:hypothetical protein